MRRIPIVAAALLLLVPAASASASVADELRAAQKRANRAAGDLARAETDLARVTGRVAELRHRAAESRSRLASLEAVVQDVAVLQYVSGGVGSSWVLGRDLNAAVRATEMARIATGEAVGAMERWRALREDFEADAEALAEGAEAQREAVADLRRRRARAAAEVDRLARLQAELEARARAEVARREAARREAARRERVRLPPPPVGGAAGRILGSGDWICPVQGPRAFSNDWGQPRSGGRRHQGNDILAPRGTPVVASVSGLVKHHNSRLGGLSYWLHGDDGNVYFGTHLHSFGASGRVKAGTVVGTVGDSGNARGGPTHLHFELHPGGGGAVNPYPTLRRYC